MCLDSKNFFDKIETPFTTGGGHKKGSRIKREEEEEDIDEMPESPKPKRKKRRQGRGEHVENETVVIEFTERVHSVFDNDEEEVDTDFMNVETLDDETEYTVIDGDPIQVVEEQDLGEYVRERRQCKYCEKSFATDGHLARHVDHVHLGEGPHRSYRCEKCDLDFPGAQAIREHREMEHKLLPGYVNCELCELAYQKLQKSQHMKQHHENQCRFCFKKFPTPGTLRIHMKSHSDLKNFMCHICEQKFFSEKVLQFHLDWHTKTKPKKWVCDECGEECLRENSLLKHKRLKHNTEKKDEFVCGNCGKVCRSKKHHESHILKHIYGPRPDSDENTMIEKEVEVEVYEEDDLPDYIEVIKTPLLKPPVVRELAGINHKGKE